MQTLERLAAALESRLPGATGHSRRVAAYAGDLARTLGLSPSEARKVADAGAVHDIGKACVPGSVLSKPGPLSPLELGMVRGHAAVGAAMVASFGDAEIAAYVRHHHESFDGSGYPDGLAAEAIPLGARILAVVDAFDALTSDRPYRRAVAPARARAVLETEAGTQFDPAIVTRFNAGHPLLQFA